MTDRSVPAVPGGISSAGRRLPDVDGRPFVTSRARGPLIVDTAGNEYIDYVGGMGVAAFGHRPQAIADALHQAIEEGAMHGMVHRGEVEAADSLLEWAPDAEWALFTNSGSEATSLAAGIARAATGRRIIAKFAGGYHGWLSGLRFGAAGTPEALLDDGTRPEQDGVVLMRYNDREDVTRAFTERADIAAVIFEPILANAGCVLPEPGFLAEVAEMARDRGILVIVDNVMIGFRTPGLLSDAVPGVRADLMTLGKAVGGGFPVAAVLGSGQLRYVIDSGSYLTAGTYIGSPLAARAVSAAMHLATERDQMFSSARRLSQGLVQELAEIGVPAATSGGGSVFSLWLGAAAPRNYAEAAQRADDGFTRALHAAFRRQGVLVMPQRFGRYFTSTAHSDDDVDRTLAVFRDLLRAGELDEAIEKPR